MIDVVPSLNLDRLALHDSPQYNFASASTTTNSTYPQTPDFNPTLFGGFDFSDEQPFDSNFLENWFAMFQQVQTQSDHPNNELTYQTILPPFVEPSANYFAIPSTMPSTVPSTVPFNSLMTLATQHNYSQEHNFRLTQGNTNYNNNSVPGHHYLPQNVVYANGIPSLGMTGARQQNRKSIPTIDTTGLPSPAFSRSNSAASSPVNGSITQQLLTSNIAQVLNNNNNDESTLHLPMFESNNPSPTTWTSPTITISSSPEITSPTTPTYSYSGPPKSYYSRLPLHDRPFKCDQCPQSFNRNHDLKRHKRIHLAVKPYPCEFCEKQFSRKDALKRHILVKGCNKNSVRKSVATNVTIANDSRSYKIDNYVENGSHNGGYYNI